MGPIITSHSRSASAALSTFSSAPEALNVCHAPLKPPRRTPPHPDAPLRHPHRHRPDDKARWNILIVLWTHPLRPRRPPPPDQLVAGPQTPTRAEVDRRPIVPA